MTRIANSTKGLTPSRFDVDEHDDNEDVGDADVDEDEYRDTRQIEQDRHDLGFIRTFHSTCLDVEDNDKLSHIFARVLF